MFQFQPKYDIYANLIKNKLGMMDCGMEKWVQHFEGKWINADFNINSLENVVDLA